MEFLIFTPHIPSFLDEMVFKNSSAESLGSVRFFAVNPRQENKQLEEGIAYPVSVQPLFNFCSMKR